MADENVPAHAPTRSDDQILPFVAWVPIGKSNFVLDLHKRQKNPIFQISGIITSTNVNYAELLWEEFVQAIQTFLTDKENLGSPIKKGRKHKPYVIPYCRFTKIIICHLGRIYNIHQRSASLFHLAEEDFRLGNLKFVPKGEIDEVFRIPIPDELISNNIKNAPYYNAYLEMVAKHDRKMSIEKEGKKKTVSAKQPKSKPALKKASKLAPALKLKASKERPSKESADKPPKPKPTKEKSTKTTLLQPTGKEPAHYEPEPELVHQGEGDEDDMELAIKMKTETGDASKKTNSGDETKIQQIDEEQGKDVDDQVNLDEKTNELDQGQAGSDPGRTPESRPLPEHEVIDEDQAVPDPGESRRALAGLDPKPMHNEFKVDEHVMLDEPLSSSETLSSMKNLDDAYTIRDQFINDKSTEDEPGKLNAESEVVSMVNVLIYQASSLISPLSMPIIDLSPPKPAFFMKASIFTATTTTTITNLPLPPPTTTKHSKTLNNTTQNLRSRVFSLELRDLPYNINEAVYESVKEAVHISLQAPLRDHFRELPEADMKEILYQRIFKSGSYKSLPEHVALYEALEGPMERAQKDKFRSSKRRRHDTGAPGSSQPQAPQSSAKKKSDTRDAPLKDTDFAYLPKFKQRPNRLKLIPDDERLDTPKPGWVIPSSYIPDAENNWANALATIKGSGQALLISKMKAAHYLDFGLELLVPEYMWINEVCTYDIIASYGISHWWFNRQTFYIDPHIVESSRKVVRTRMRILSVVSIKAFSRYGYDYLKEITLQRSNYQDYTVAKKDFKSLYPKDFEDPNLLLLQGHLNHLSGSKKRFEYKHDYIIIDSPREVVFPVSNNERKIMRFNEIYKFSDGTLTNIMEALDFKVKEYKNIRVIPMYHSEDGNPARANIKQVLGVKLSISASGSQPSGNTKKDKIQRPPSSTQNNKVEAHPRTVKSSLKNKKCVIEPKVGISHETSSSRSPQQNSVAKRRNRMLIDVAHTMLIYAKASLFLWAEVVATASMASEHNSFEPALHEMTPVTISSGLVLNPPPSTSFVPPSRTDWDLLFQPLFNELLTLSPSVDHPAPKFIALIAEVVALEPATSTSLPFLTTVDQDAPSPSNSQTTPKTQTRVISNDVE
nr:putative ribonuclease H-like domain-containing protein [Tanacetum cinerariifolium]